MAKKVTGKALISKYVRGKDKVLLINPPVEETRYSWTHWNQPLDLLKVGFFLRNEIGCNVQLLDCMRANAQGETPWKWLTGSRRYCVVGDQEYPMRHFGQTYRELAEQLPREQTREVTQVWITSLCSYWFEAVAQVCRTVRQTLPEARVVLTGNYPRLMDKQAADCSGADFVVTDSFDLDDQCALELYQGEPPQFLALCLNPRIAMSEMKSAVAQNVGRFTFYEEDICKDDGNPLEEIVRAAEDLGRPVKFHVICGLHPAGVSPRIARILASPIFAELHFEEADLEGDLDTDVYVKASSYLREAGLELPNKNISGFVWIGRPGESIEQIVLRSFRVLESFGGVILKPFSPTPGSEEYRRHLRYLKPKPPRELSPHFFPFAAFNGITRREYHDLYRMSAFLNEKVRARAFDLLNGTLGARLLRNSLIREVWKLYETPVSSFN